jgi:hypothetical protein
MLGELFHSIAQTIAWAEQTYGRATEAYVEEKGWLWIKINGEWQDILTCNW